MMIVITAPTSQIGSQLLASLLADEARVRVIARYPGKLPKDVRDRVEVVEGSHGDPHAVDRAFDGADALFWLAPPAWQQTLEEAYLDFTRPAAMAIRRHGVARVASVTALGRGTQWQAHAGPVTTSICDGRPAHGERCCLSRPCHAVLHGEHRTTDRLDQG